ncbi:MAG: hypothetical protein KJO07_07805 [Deltaproteobacteria bacterium]|nr:hypothetical protein [Deltaproteobacteria bacterium]
MAKLLEYNATILERTDCTPELSIFRMQHDQPIDTKPPFVPGQYVALGLNNEELPEKGAVRRSMSLAGAPEQDNGFEFYIRYVNKPESDNPLTHLLWKSKVGDRVFMTRKPVGKFTLPDTMGEDDPRVKIMVAAGTGLAPFVSMARSAVMRDPKVDLSSWAILHGASYPADLVYADELAGYAENNRLKYMRTVSRPNEAPDWKGDTGRVEDYFKAERLAELEERLGLATGKLSPKTAGILICGLQGTIAQTIIRTLHRGFVPDHRRIREGLGAPADATPSIWWEQYDKTPVIDVKDEAVVGPLKEKLAQGLAAIAST